MTTCTNSYGDGAEHDQGKMKLVIGVLVLDIMLLGLSVVLVVLTLQVSSTCKTSQIWENNSKTSQTCADNSSTVRNTEAIHELVGSVKSLRRSLAKTDKSLVTCHEEITDLQEELAKLTSPNVTDRAACYVSLSQDVNNPEVKRPILFDRETLDLTQNYNPNDGKFTAKVSGVYSFTWTVATTYGQYIFATLMHNDFITGRIISGDSVDSSMGTGTAILHLKEGDTVMVVVDQKSSSAVVMASMSALSGFFISA